MQNVAAATEQKYSQVLVACSTEGAAAGDWKQPAQLQRG